MKRCCFCKKVKENCFFYKDRRRPDGLYSRCKLCHQKSWYKKGKYKKGKSGHFYYTLAEWREIQRKWRKKNPEAVKRIHKKWKRKTSSRIKLEAYRELKKALEKGKIQKMPCEKCGASRTHGHHEDYSKPLAVRWLCAFHHKQVHSDIHKELCSTE